MKERIAYRLKVSIVTVLSICSLTMSAQNFGQWIWMHGSNAANVAGVYGTQGVAAPGNTPPAMYETTELVDLQGNFWLFGGLDNAFQEHAALWKFDPITNMWTWMKGPNTVGAAGVYGVQGIPAPGNYPGSRAWGVLSWTDAAGNLYIFGGYGYDAFGTLGALSDLWKYDITTNMWTWMKGPNVANDPGTYGTLQVPANTNNPPSRFETAASWTANNGDMYMYGGGGFLGYYSDMWRYSPGTNQWTWMSGSNATNVAPNFGTQLIPSPTNTPGARYTYGRWKDLQGNLWLFGGSDALSGTWADMWRYDLTTHVWTWMAGSNVANTPGNFGTKCVAGSQFPASRYENRCAWTDDCGRFWQFGGFSSGISTLNDLWMFDPNTLQFTWVGGSTALNQPGNYGTVTVAAPTNYPEGGAGGAAFRDLQGNFWMFGAWVPAGKSNSMWKYTLDPNCPAPTQPQVSINFTPNGSCAPLNVNFNASTNNLGYTYHWNFGDPSTTGDTANTPAATYTYTSGGTYTVTLIISGTVGCATGSDTATAIINVPSGTSVNLGNDTAICGAFNLTLNAGSATAYQWSTGATSSTINVSNPGTYSVITNPSSGCPGYDTIVISAATGPNIGPDSTFCQGGSVTLAAGIANSYLWSTGATTSSITVNASGQYYVDVTIGSCTFSDTVNITVNPAPIVNLGNDTAVCGNFNIPLNAQNPGAQYVWSNASTSQTINATAAGTYYVTVTANNCSSSDTIVITAVQPPNVGSDTSACEGVPIVLTAGVVGQSYLWNDNSTNATLTAITTGTYWVEVTNGACVMRDSIDVTVFALPIIDLGNDTTLCPGNTLTLNAGNPGSSYAWSTGAQSQTIVADSADMYVVTVTGTGNCLSTDSITIGYLAPLNFSEEVSLCGSFNITLDAGNPGATYQWSNGATSQTIEVSTAGDYGVMVDLGGCILYDTTTVTGVAGEGIVFIPNTFTPNKGGPNEIFYVYGDGINDFSMMIFNRWGQLIFQTNDINKGWDGYFKGQICQVDTYVYVVQYRTVCAEKTIKKVGHVNLIR
jgi:gliding motility-associated-like protein